jgi:hypothetical protein
MKVLSQIFTKTNPYLSADKIILLRRPRDFVLLGLSKRFDQPLGGLLGMVRGRVAAREQVSAGSFPTKCQVRAKK